MNIVQIVAIGLVTAVLSMTVKRQSPDFSLLIAIGGSVLIFVLILPSLGSVINVITKLTDETKIDSSYVMLVLKVVGIAYLAEFGAQICNDANESAIASKIELAGKVLIMLISAPVLISLTETILGLLP